MSAVGGDTPPAGRKEVTRGYKKAAFVVWLLTDKDGEG
jgi:hypothetical protein